ncbi:hypothetical protein SCCGRSA3_01928 [Marine Group I thaumarchaeote SCGC RSA3]|uniref:Uncharacterized protein n=2 Tax=Marine Group I TaxID=905826 RepID=A0A081RP06_9ARCH|nr:hypothetical protein AAA799N04_00599 [Marine Group I thaumarchaeote SCGC AAA799-N04]KFM17405.1 hypothetical protein SCCGRSA3_01928 [Marine Group I thaumarchaeote SCGC RSA3]
MSKQNTESYDTYNTCAENIKNQIRKEGIWKPYTNRIKNLLLCQDKLWELYNAESNLEGKRRILEDLINLQPLIAEWYSTSKKIIEFEADAGVCN